MVLIKLTSERPVTFTFGKETVTTNVKRLQSGSRIRSGPSGFTSESALPNHSVTAFSADVEKNPPQNTQILNVHIDFICIAGVKSLLTPIKNDIAENLPQPHFDRNSR